LIAPPPSQLTNVDRKQEPRGKAWAPAFFSQAGIAALGQALIRDDAGNFVSRPQRQFMPRFVADGRDNAKHHLAQSAAAWGMDLVRPAP
jgi:hypothetical protein